MVEAIDEQYQFRGIDEQVITSFTKMQVPRDLGGQDVQRVPSITDGNTFLVCNDGPFVFW